VFGPDPASPLDIVEPERAMQLFEQARKSAARAAWSGPTWSRLALLGVLLGHDAAGNSFAERARAAGASLTAYYEASVRSLLGQERAREALPVAERLVAVTQGAPTARVLLAAAAAAAGDFGGADAALAPLTSLSGIGIYDRLLLARVYIALEHWPKLQQLLDGLRNVPAPCAREHTFLLAVSFAKQKRTVEALAILDGLRAVPATSPAEAARLAGWTLPGPSPYDLEIWRGVTLLESQQFQAAREVLEAAAAVDPGRAEVHFYLGWLEARAQRPEVAAAHLKNALAGSARHVPAWELLAVLELDANRLDAALENVRQATRLNPRRASAHFLTALAEARLGHKGPAAEALKTACQLDPGYATEAQAAEVLTRLFEPAELEALTSSQTQPATSPSEPNAPITTTSEAPADAAPKTESGK
jgi:tetratricopeptide (TPR) repeat protein